MSKIEWTEKTWNPVIGCQKIAAGCKNCYAERMSTRINGMAEAAGNIDLWAAYSEVLKFDGPDEDGMRATGFNGNVKIMRGRLGDPNHWKRGRLVFVNSMSDLFHEGVPDDFIIKVYSTMIDVKQHIYQILTKRPERARTLLSDYSFWQKVYNAAGRTIGTHEETFLRRIGNTAYPKNVCLGVSVSTQADADKNIPVLLDTPAAVRWVSVEPMLEGIDLNPLIKFPETAEQVAEYEKTGKLPAFLDWVVVGCESGPKRRECKIEWVESTVEQCKSAGVPVFVKQLNIGGKVVKDMSLFPEGLRVREWPKSNL